VFLVFKIDPLPNVHGHEHEHRHGKDIDMDMNRAGRNFQINGITLIYPFEKCQFNGRMAIFKSI
jgi:hypothetical protein